MTLNTYRPLLLLFFPALAVQAQTFINGQAARAVIGQNEFTAAIPNTQQYILGGVSGVAYGNGILFVADSNRVQATPQNNRVLLFNTSQIPPPHADLTGLNWPDSSCFLCGYSAINVLGQQDYVSSNPGTANAPYQSSGLTLGWMQTPTAVATDGHILAAADTDNNRVLIWNFIPTAMDQPADLVLGQSSFTSNTTPEPPTASSLSGPQGVWIQNGKLFVADTQNYRVLIWNSIPTANNQPADVVLGQSNFNTGTQSACNPLKNEVASANELCNPVSVTSDGTHVFVADLGFNRVLIWNSIPTQMGQNADVEIGQPDMTGTLADNSTAVCPGDTTTGLECGATLNFPRFALSDGTRLFIADGGNDRVLIFNSIPTTNAANADEVLGQLDFTTDVVSNQTQTITSTTIDNTSAVNVTPTPTSLAFDGINLYVSDPYDRRVLVFTPGDTALPNNSVVNWASEIIRQEGVVSIGATSIVANDTVTITIAGTDYTYTVVKTDTPDTIAQGLVSKINGGNDPNVTAIFAGTGTGSVYLSSKQTNLPFDSISLAASASNTADLTVTTSGSYLSSGTGATAAPGMLVEVDGSNLSDSSTQACSSFIPNTCSGTLPTNLGDVEVYMDGIASPVLSVSPTQVVAQVPFAFTDRNSTSVYVRTIHAGGNVTVTNATAVYIAPANPGLFNAPSYPNQPRPWPAAGAFHQPGNPTAVVSIDGTAKAGDQATITVNGRNYTYTEVSGDTLSTVVQNLVNLINSAPDPQVTAAQGAAFDRVVLTAIQGGQAGTGIPISGSTNSGSSITVTPYTSATCCAVTPGTPISDSNPAVPGELITLSATGLGTLVDVNGNALASPEPGTPYEGTQPNTAANSVSATMGGQTAEVISAGLAQGSYGIYEVQMIVPSGLPNDDATEVYIAQNAFISNIVTIPVGPAVMVSNNTTPPPSPITVDIDNPAQGASLSGVVAIGGWAIDNNAPISSVTVLVDGQVNGTASYGGNRQDVCNNLPAPGCPNVGWNYLLDTTRIPNGNHTLEITANGADGLHYTVAVSFTVSNASGSLPTHLFIDRPGPQDGAFQGLITVSGWALNDTAAISNVTISVDGHPVGTAQYGVDSKYGNRPDVCNAYPGRPGCPNVGWSFLLNTNSLSNGTHSLEVTATATNGQAAAVATSFTVANWTTADPINIDIDVPNSQSGALSGTVALGGWAIDANSPITNVQISVDGASLGNAAYGGSRPDVCSAFPGTPGCPNVGWNFGLDTTQLADGSHTLAVTATSAAGQSATMTTTFTVANFTVSNPMRVFIDTPNSQSGALSGSSLLSGWAISTNAVITSVQILVDGVVQGTASPVIRNDVCMAYPQAQGCPNVGWSFLLDTTLLANGTHVLEVRATSASGEHGTASVSFAVSNSASNGSTKVFIDQPNSFSNPFLGLAFFYGWAINTSAPISSVTISVDGFPVGTADYGMNSSVGYRPDVCNVYPGAGCPYVGWSFLLDTTRLADGTHTLDVFATASDGTHLGVSSSFTVANWSSSNPMTIAIDTPNSSSGPFSGTAHFGGWAVDADSAISSVSVSVDGIPFGAAAYGGNRSDVCAVLSAAGCPNVGWNAVIDTTLLPNGSHTLEVTAVSSSGQSSTVTAGFVVEN